MQLTEGDTITVGELVAKLQKYPPDTKVPEDADEEWDVEVLITG